MARQIVIDEEGAITLPADLIAGLGWTPETRLRMTLDENGMTLTSADDDEIEPSS